MYRGYNMSYKQHKYKGYKQGFCMFYEGKFKTFLRPTKEHLRGKNQWKNNTAICYLSIMSREHMKSCIYSNISM